MVAGWQQLAINQDATGVSLSSNIGTGAIALKFNSTQAKVLRNDPTFISVGDRRVTVDHLEVDNAFRGKPGDAVLAAYHDFINADLQRRGWKEVVSERTKFAAGGKTPALYWVMQAETGAANSRSLLTLSLAAAATPGGVVALSAVAEDAQGGPALKKMLTEALATLQGTKPVPLVRDDIVRLRQEAQRFIYRIAKTGSVILLNDELASPQDRETKDPDIQKYVLTAENMAAAAAAAVEGSPNGPFMTFINDGRSQHAFLIHGYNPQTSSFEYSDSTGSNSLLEVGNNVAGVEAVRKPNTTDRLWLVKKDQLQNVLSGMIVGEADLLAVQRKIQLGPLGKLGDTSSKALQTDFFKFFHLEETAKTPSPDGSVLISYAPTAPKFRPLVTVRLRLAPGGWISNADLLIKRRLLEDPRDESSGRDICKSFLEAATLDADWTKIHRLHDEIFYLGATRMMVSEAAAKNVTIPLLPSGGYEVFTNGRGHFIDMLSRSRLWMENGTFEGEPTLLISIGSG